MLWPNGTSESTSAERRTALFYFGVVTFLLFAPILAGHIFLPVGFLYRTPLWYDASFPLKSFDMFDSIIYFYPLEHFLRDSLLNGEFPLWNPYNLGGHPVAFNGQSGFFYPPRLLAAVLLPSWLGHGFLLSSHLFMAGVATYLFGRALKLSHYSALFAGTAWMLNPFIIGWLPCEHTIVASPWIPLSLLAVLKCRDCWSGSAWFGLSVAMLVTSGHLQHAACAFGSVILVGGCYLLREKAAIISWLRVVFGGVLGALLSAPVLLPSAFYMSRSQRPTIPLDFLLDTYRQFLQSSPITTIFPAAYGNASSFAVKQVSGAGEFVQAELSLYTGVVVLALALTSCTTKGLGRWVCAASALLLLLPATPLYAAVRALPGFEHLISTRTIQALHFPLAIAAALGLESLVERRRQFSGLCGLLGCLGLGWAFIHLTRDSSATVASLLESDTLRLPRREMFLDDGSFLEAAQLGFNQLYSWTNPAFFLPLLVLGIAAVVTLKSAEPKKILVGLIAIELLTNAYLSTTHNHHKDLFVRNQSIETLSAAGVERVLGLGTIKPNTLLPFRIQDVGGYDSFYPVHSGRYLAYLMHGTSEVKQLPAQVFPIRRYRSPLVDLLGVRYFVTYPSQGLQGLPRVAQSPLPIFENPHRLDRAFVTTKYRVVADDQEALSLLDSGEVDAAKEVILSTEPSLKPALGSEASAKIISYGANEVEVLAEADSPALVVLTDGFAEGWQVTVDGQPAELLRANVMFRAVSIPEGKHNIRFQFRPRLYSLGWVLFGLGCLFFVSLGLIHPKLKERRGEVAG